MLPGEYQEFFDLGVVMFGCSVHRSGRPRSSIQGALTLPITTRALIDLLKQAETLGGGKPHGARFRCAQAAPADQMGLAGQRTLIENGVCDPGFLFGVRISG
jgi:hypothetical protein